MEKSVLQGFMYMGPLLLRYEAVSLAGRLVNQATSVLSRQLIGGLKYALILQDVQVVDAPILQNEQVVDQRPQVHAPTVGYTGSTHSFTTERTGTADFI